MNATGPNALERHCRLLLRVYPPGYRRQRGEEILGTVLQGVPAGRNWPPPAKYAGSSGAACGRAPHRASARAPRRACGRRRCSAS
jgi:hypothetical protein